jgi:hypothetical protein
MPNTVNEPQKIGTIGFGRIGGRQESWPTGIVFLSARSSHLLPKLGPAGRNEGKPSGIPRTRVRMGRRPLELPRTPPKVWRIPPKLPRTPPKVRRTPPKLPRPPPEMGSGKGKLASRTVGMGSTPGQYGCLPGQEACAGGKLAIFDQAIARNGGTYGFGDCCRG